MSRLFATIVRKFDEVSFGDPPKKWKLAFIFLGAVYFDLVEKFVYFLPRTELYINEQNTWEHVNWHVSVDYCGSLLCLIVSPLVDNYHLHQYMVLVCNGLISVLSVLYTYTLFLPPWKAASQASLLTMSAVTQFTKPIFISYCLIQFPERVGPPSKFFFTVFLTISWALVGFVQVALRWANHDRIISSIFLLSFFLITSYPLFMGVFIAIAIRKKDGFCKPESKPGDTFLALRCISRAISHIKGGSCFGHMLYYFDYTTVTNSKKASKLFLLILALSFNSTLLHVLDIPWMFEYFTLNRSDLFAVIEFSALCSFLTAIFIPLTEYVLIPLVRKFKLPIPIYSFMLCLAYIFTCIASAATVWMHLKIEEYQSTRLDYDSARVYLINTLDTYSYVVASGFPKTRIPSASIKSYLVGDDDPTDDLLKIDFQIQNLYYGSTNDLVRMVKPKSITSYVLTNYEAYEIPADGLTQPFFKVINDPSTIFWPTLMFICPRNRSGNLYEWCNAKVKIWFYGARIEEHQLDLMEVGNGTVMDMPPDRLTTITMNFRPNFNHDKEIIQFTPVQGGKYVLLVWTGDIHLKVKYRVITVHTPPQVNPNSALTQIICRALGVSMGIVSLCTLVKINTPHCVFTIAWAIVALSQKIFIPFFLFLNYFNFREAKFQIPFVVINCLMFFLFILVIRIVRA